MKFEVGKRYRITQDPSPRHMFGGCDVSAGDEFVVTFVDEDGAPWSRDVTFGGKSRAGDGWCVGRASNLRSGEIIPVEEIGMNRDKLRDELERHEQRCAELRRKLEKPEKWEPEGGPRFINTGGNVHVGPTSDRCRKFGAERPTREQAERAARKMRIHNRALAYVDEHAPDWDGSGAWSVYYEEGQGAWRAQPMLRNMSEDLGAVTGPRWVMKKLADDLNSGRVDLEGGA